jgi:hypothetical protein
LPERGQRLYENLLRLPERHPFGARQFAQLVTVGVSCDRYVRVVRRRVRQQSLKPDLPASRIDQIDATNDLRDALLVVVDDDREMVGNEPVTVSLAEQPVRQVPG